jgi:hypothetical protein
LLLTEERLSSEPLFGIVICFAAVALMAGREDVAERVRAALTARDEMLKYGIARIAAVSTPSVELSKTCVNLVLGQAAVVVASIPYSSSMCPSASSEFFQWVSCNPATHCVTSLGAHAINVPLVISALRSSAPLWITIAVATFGAMPMSAKRVAGAVP